MYLIKCFIQWFILLYVFKCEYLVSFGSAGIGYGFVHLDSGNTVISALVGLNCKNTKNREAE